MKPFVLLFSLIFFAAPGTYEAAIPFFSHVRDVTVSAPYRQNYIMVDRDIWAHARPDLSDIRLYDGQAQVPYVLSEQHGGVSSAEQEAKILNLGSVAGHTEFDLDVSAPAEYDHIRLQLTAKDFVNIAQTEGRDELSKHQGVQLGKSTLYDFTKENLGSNSIIKLPTSSFRFLHVQLERGISPEQVKGAYVFRVQEKQAAWMPVGEFKGQTSGAKQTVDSWQVSPKVPVERIRFRVAANEVNFCRTVSVTDAQGAEVARGCISRVRMVRGGTTVVSEDLDLNLPETRTSSLTVHVENGDDRPLRDLSTQPLSMERRIYFDPGDKTALKLYVGDNKLEAPIYDYAKFFQQDVAAVKAKLGPDSANPAYTGRPDDRPWSERHTMLLWTAMILAIAVLAVLAVRGFRSAA